MRRRQWLLLLLLLVLHLLFFFFFFFFSPQVCFLARRHTQKQGVLWIGFTERETERDRERCSQSCHGSWHPRSSSPGAACYSPYAHCHDHQPWLAPRPQRCTPLAPLPPFPLPPLCFVLVAVTFPEIKHKKKRSAAGVGGGEEDTRKHNRCGRAMPTTTTKRDLKPTAQKLKTSDKICTVFGGTLTQHRKNPRCISVFRFPNCSGSVLFLFFLSPAPPHPPCDVRRVPSKYPPGITANVF